MDYAATHGSVNANSLMAAYGMKPTTARQYLSTLAKESALARIGQLQMCGVTALNTYPLRHLLTLGIVVHCHIH